MKENKKNILIVLLIVLNILSLSGFFIYEKINKNEKESDKTIEIENELKNQQNRTTFDVIIGTYEYNYEILNTDEYCTSEYLDGKETLYMKLVLNEDGTASGVTGEKCSGGYPFDGRYYINKNEIIIDNEKCKINNIDGECIYPNCEKKVTFKYEIIDGIASIEFANKKITQK